MLNLIISEFELFFNCKNFLTVLKELGKKKELKSSYFVDDKVFSSHSGSGMFLKR